MSNNATHPGSLPNRPSPRGRLLATAYSVAIWTSVLLLVAIELTVSDTRIRYLFYGLLGLHLLALGFRAYRTRNDILFRFAPGTKEGLGDDRDAAEKGLRDRLELRARGYRVGFLETFAREFRQVDRCAHSEPAWIDKLIDFVAYAFPFQSNLVSILSKPLRDMSERNSYLVTVSRQLDGGYILHATAGGEAIPIQLAGATLEECLDEAAGRMYHQISAADLTPNYRAYAAFCEALAIWAEVSERHEKADTDLESAAEAFRRALTEDPDFILATLYLAAMHSIRRSSSSYFERSKQRLKRVMRLCDMPSTPGSPVFKRKAKGLAIALSCNLTSQWLHRVGKYDNEDEAIVFASSNQGMALQAVDLLPGSPLAIHEYAFSLHCLEQTMLRRPHALASLTSDYVLAVEKYTEAIRLAEKEKSPPAARRSMNNRGYLMTWLGAMLRRDPEAVIDLRLVVAGPTKQRIVADRLWDFAEREMRGVGATSLNTNGEYAVANLCLLYALKGDYGRMLSCALTLNGLEPRQKSGGKLILDTIELDEARRLDPKRFSYLEGANDVAVGLLAACASGAIEPSLYAEWLEKGLALHERSLELILENEANNVTAMRLRAVKQMTNLLKMLHFADPKRNGPAETVFRALREKLLGYRDAERTVEGLAALWLTDLREALLESPGAAAGVANGSR